MNNLDFYTLTSEDWEILNRFGNPHRYEDDAIRDDEVSQDFRFELNWGTTVHDFVTKKCTR